MAYRYTAAGTLELSERHVNTVCGILTSKRIQFQRTGTTVVIEHDEKACTPSEVQAADAFEDLAPYVTTPQVLNLWSELTGDCEIGFVDGRVQTDEFVHVWSQQEQVPAPDDLVNELKQRGIAARVIQTKGTRKSGRRARVFQIQPGSGGPACRVTIKRRFWDSYDLLSVPDVYQPLCRKYHLKPKALRDTLRGSSYGLEVRKPALGTASSTLVYDSLVDVIEDLIDGIRTKIG